MKKILLIIGTIIILIFLFIGPFAILGSLFYNRQDIESIAERTNLPILCALVPPNDNCEEGSPCSQPDKCYYDVAVNTKNSKACDYMNKNETVGIPISNGLRVVAWQDCYFDSGANLREVYEKCRDMSVNGQAKCYGFFASKLNDPSICETGKDDSVRAGCYAEFAWGALNVDSNFCDKIFSNFVSDVSKWRDSCYYGLAVNTKDFLLCGKIINTESKRYCETDVKNKK